MSVIVKMLDEWSCPNVLKCTISYLFWALITDSYYLIYFTNICFFFVNEWSLFLVINFMILTNVLCVTDTGLLHLLNSIMIKTGAKLDSIHHTHMQNSVA